MGITLKPLDESDLGRALNWRNDPRINWRFRDNRALTMIDQMVWYWGLRSPMFVIVEGTGFFKPIGVGGLCHWDMMNRNAELSAYIGETGYEDSIHPAIDLLLEYGFKTMHLRRIYAERYDFDSSRFEEAHGFKVEGHLRDVLSRGGRFWGSTILSITETDYVGE